MAKKKRRRNRRPIAPPVHSAPDMVHGPAGPRASEPPPARPVTPEPPRGAEPATYSATPMRTREAARRRPPRRRKKGRGRTYVIVGAIVALIVAAVVTRQVLGSRRTNEFNDLARGAGCSEIRDTESSGGQQHLAEGAEYRYGTSPPTYGPHDGRGVVTAGVYDEPFSRNSEEQPSIYRAVHSLEHGYVIVWHEGLNREQERELARDYRAERKVIVVPYPQLRGDTKIAMTAWGRMVTCERLSTRVIDSFIELFREARSAPEPKSA